MHHSVEKAPSLAAKEKDGVMQIDAADATVFVVDSDALARNMVCDLARNMRLRYEAYASGRAFLEAYDRSRPGCLVSEVRIPDVSGLQIQRQLAIEGNPLPVIFLSAHATVAVVVRAMQGGAVHFLEKPPCEQELWEAIQEAIRVDVRGRVALLEKQRLKEKIGLLTGKEREGLELL